MATASSPRFVVVGWKKMDDRPLPHTLVDAANIKKVVVRGEVEIGKEAYMVFNGEQWEGTILSIHGKLNLR